MKLFSPLKTPFSKPAYAEKKANNFKHKAVVSTLASCVLLTACGSAKTTDSNAAKAEKSDTSTAKTVAAAVPDDQKLDSKTEAKLKENLTKNLKASGFDTSISSVRATKMPALFWVNADGLPAFFTDKTGKFIIQGDVIEIGGESPVDVSAPLKKADAVAQLASVKEKDMVIFKAKGETKAVVYAFTDVDCGYCRKLHSEMKDINKKGIEVRYLAWPRSPQSVPSMVSIWCAKDRNATMNTAKAGDRVTPATCENPVEAQVELGHKLGVRGTPAIYTENGTQIGGYLPAADLAKAAIQNK